MALLQVGDLQDAGIAAALRLPPRAAPCDARTGESAATQAGAGEVPGLAGSPECVIIVQPPWCATHCWHNQITHSTIQHLALNHLTTT